MYKNHLVLFYQDKANSVINILSLYIQEFEIIFSPELILFPECLEILMGSASLTSRLQC